jgi:hypothetical protein
MNEMNFVQTQRTRPKQVAARREASTAPGAGRALPSRHRVQGGALAKVRTPFEDAHGFRKCASWKTSTIPSKVRTVLQDAHTKLRTFAELRARNVCGAQFHGGFGRLRLGLAHPSSFRLHPSTFILPTSVASVAELSHNGGLDFADFDTKVNSHAS